MPAICALCNVKESRYKCPKCTIPYCSLACYKPHKAAHLAARTPPPAPPPPDASSNLVASASSAAPGTEKVPLPDHKFAGLANDPKVQALLADPELRKKLWGVYRQGKEQDQRWRADGMDEQLVGLNRLRGEDDRVEELVRGIVGSLAGAEEEGK